MDDDYITPDGIIALESATPGLKSFSMHILQYRRIQSEMQVVLHEKQCPAYPAMDLGAWQQSMHHRIQDWYDGIPHNSSLAEYEKRMMEHFELTFHWALFYLYHPSLNIPIPSESALVTITDTATQMIQLYRRFFCEQRLTLYWQAVENLSSAGTALMYAYVNSTVVQERLTFRSLESLIHTCSSVLWGMVEHFPAFKGKRDAFDIMATKVLPDLVTSPTAADRTDRLLLLDSITTSRPVDSETDGRYASPSVPQSDCQLLPGACPEGQPRFAALSSEAADQIQAECSQYPPPAAGESNAPIPQAAFSDFDDASFDWEAFENLNEGSPPIWLL